MSNTQKLYDDLMALTQVEGSDAFYFKDEGNHRVFNYRMASYSDWLKPSALEARGIMFYMKEKEPILVCRPFKKFFNLDETPFTMGLDLTKVVKAAVKEDGSLITSYIDLDHGGIRLKSKVSLSSDQAVMAMEVLDAMRMISLKAEVYNLTSDGYTVMFELVSPANRIVLEYEKTEIRVIGVRSLETGEMIFKSDIEEEYPWIARKWVTEGPVTKEDVDSMPSLTNVEGYVLTMHDGLMVKVKTDWYKNLHHLKDSVESVKNLFEAIIDEQVDDVKAMFKTDQFTIDRISAMEAKVIPIFNNMVATVEKFYAANKDLTKKDYAIKGQAEIGNYFNLSIGLYLGREPDYKGYAKKYREEIFGLKEPVPEQEPALAE